MTTEPKRRTKLSLHDKDKILTQFQNGLNNKEISEVTGMAYHQVNNYLQKVKKRRGGADRERADLEKAAAPTKPKQSGPRKMLTQEQLDQMLALWDAGIRSYTEIARRVGCADATVHAKLKPMLAARGETPARHPKAINHPKLKPQQPAISAAPQSSLANELEREIMKAELRLEILKELKGKR